MYMLFPAHAAYMETKFLLAATQGSSSVFETLPFERCISQRKDY